MDTLDAAALVAISSLDDPTRAALYACVVNSDDAVGRDEAAVQVGVSRQTAAYHLDRLVDDGLLEVEFRRLSGRTGPGAGRPAKLYRRGPASFEITVPPRRYEIAARILLDAAGEDEGGRRRLRAAAHRLGHRLGSVGLEEALTSNGYEPAEESDEIRFRNCPFPVLRDQDRATTCGMNLALVEGMIEGAGAEAEARLDPEAGYCCVRIRPRSTGAG